MPFAVREDDYDPNAQAAPQPQQRKKLVVREEDYADADPTVFDSLEAAGRKAVRMGTAGIISAPVEIGNLIGNITEWGAGGFDGKYRYRQTSENPALAPFGFENVASAMENFGDATADIAKDATGVDFLNPVRGRGLIPEDRVPQARNSFEDYLFPISEFLGAGATGPAGLLRKGGTYAMARLAQPSTGRIARMAPQAVSPVARAVQATRDSAGKAIRENVMLPSASSAGRDLASGVAAHVAGGAGVGYMAQNYPDQPIMQVLGGLVGLSTVPGVRLAGRATRGVLRGGKKNVQAMQAAEEAAARQGVTSSLPAMYAPGYNMENLLEGTIAGRSPGGASTIRTAVKDMNDQAARRVETFAADKFGGQVPTNAEAGSVITGAVDRAVKTFGKNSNHMETVLKGAVTSDPVPVSNTVRALTIMRNRAASDPDVNAALRNPTIERVWNTLMNREPNSRVPPGHTTFNGLYEFRKEIGEALGETMALEKGQKAGSVKFLYKAMAQDLDQIANSMPGSVQFGIGGKLRTLPVGRAWKFMKRYEARGQRGVRDTLQPLVEGNRINPDGIFANVMRMKRGDLRRVLKTLRPDEHVAVASQILRQMGKVEGAQGWNLSNFATAVKSGKASGRLQLAMAGKHMQEVRQIIDDLELLGEGRKRFQAFSHDVSGMTTGSLAGGAAIFGSAFSGNLPLAAGIFSALYAAPYAVAKIVTWPRYRQWLARTRSMKPSLRSAQAGMSSLIRMIAADPNRERQEAAATIALMMANAFKHGDTLDQAALIPVPGVQEVAGLLQSVRMMARGDIPVNAEQLWLTWTGLTTIGPSAHALMAAGGAGGALAMSMIGMKAKSFPHEKLATAHAMLKAGKTPDEISAATGLHQGPDKIWRYEISDKDLQLDRTSLGKLLAAQDVSIYDLLDHDLLRAAYPEALRKVKVATGGVRGNAIAQYDPVNNTIRVGSDLLRNMRAAAQNGNMPLFRQQFNTFKSYLLHETQHAIQRIEDTARGGSAGELMIKQAVAKVLHDLYPNEVKRMIDLRDSALAHANAKRIVPASRFDELYDTEIARWGVDKLGEFQELSKLTDKMNNLDGAVRFQAYRHLYGEMEARGVQSRMDMSEAELRAKPIQQTYREEVTVSPDGSRWENYPDQAIVRRWKDADNYPKTLPAKSSLTADAVDMPETPKYRPGQLRRNKQSGKYIGAPRWVKTPRQLGKVYSDYYDHVKTGVGGRDWYERVGKTIFEYTNRNKGDAMKAARIAARTSTATSLGTNARFTAQAKTQNAVGQEVKTGRFPNAMKDDLNAIYSGQGVSGRKIEPFAENIARGGGFSNADKSQLRRPVNDMWQMIAFGYSRSEISGGAGAAGHAFMDKVTARTIARANKEKLGGYDNWDEMSLQAAAWVGARIKNGDMRPEDASLGFREFFERMEGQHSWESVPGSTSGHMPALRDQPLDTRQQYHQGVKDIVSGGTGRDRIVDAFGGLQRDNSMIDGPGVFEGGVNPGTQTRAVMSGTAKAVDPEGHQLARATEAARSLLLAQDAGAWHRAVVGLKKKDGRVAVEFNMGGPVTNDQIMAVMPKLREMGVGDMAPIPTETGMRVLYFGDRPDVFRRNMKALQSSLGTPEGNSPSVKPDMTDGNYDSGYISNDWTKNKLGQEYLREFNTPQLRESFDKIMPGLAADLMKHDKIWSARLKTQIAPHIQALREAVARGGIKEVEKLIASGAFPAVLAALVMPYIMRAEQET